jgi:radical SAM protein with 4Fe4S-binding SPASM domain
MSTLLYPPFLQWEICSECNHKCIHCYNYWRADNIPVEQCENYLNIADKIIERKPLYVAITGGEPLLVFPKVKECIDKFTACGITVSISTNGTLITEEIAQYLSEKKVDLVISLPSINKKVCDSVCCANNVVDKLSKVWPLLKKYHITTNVNVVINKLNISTLYETLTAIKELGFIARVGMAQRPINASSEYLKYELDKNDFNYIVKQVIKAKKELNLKIDFSVCMPDCAFSDPYELKAIEKGDCFGGTLAYAICTNGDIKACQCDTMVYGNILRDPFEQIYEKMVAWRDGSLIPSACEGCKRLDSCRGGCRVESFANKDDYKGLPSFADVEHIPDVLKEDEEELIDYSNVTNFEVNSEAVFLKDLQCYRVSVGIVPTHLSFEFGDWLMAHKSFSFKDLIKDCEIPTKEVNLVLNLLFKNGIIKPIDIEK